MTIPKKRLRRSLLTKFGFEPVKESRHEAVSLIVEGQKLATTRFSRGADRDLGPGLLKQMAKQLRLSRLAELHEMVDCTLDRETYLAKVRSRR